MSRLLLSFLLVAALVGCDSDGADTPDAAAAVDTAADLHQTAETDTSPAVDTAADVGPDSSAPPAPFTFAVVSDTHLWVNEDAANNLLFIEAGRRFGALEPPPAFVVSTGDNVHDLFCLASTTANDEPVPMLELYRSLIAEYFAMPFRLVLGNHDNRYLDTFQGNDDAWRAWLRAFEETPSLPAPYYAFDHEGFRMVVLACTDEATDHASNDRCTIGPDQERWLDEQLAAGLPTVLFWHHAMDPPADDAAPAEDDHLLFQLIAAHGETVRAVFAGHRHRFGHAEWRGVHFYETDAFTDAATPPYHLVTCDPATGGVTAQAVTE